MKRTGFIFGFLILLSACTERMICPAYQSAFIHDKNALMAHFSYFNPDSTPKVREVDKSRFLIVKEVPYEKRVREMQTIVMQDVYPQLIDSAEFEDDLMLAERDVIDSTAIEAQNEDKIHPGLIGPFNTEQELYMWYLRDILLLPDARAEMKEEEEKKQEESKRSRKERKQEEPAQEEQKEKKGPFSIFNKKDKDEKTEEPAPDNEPAPDGGEDF